MMLLPTVNNPALEYEKKCPACQQPEKKVGHILKCACFLLVSTTALKKKYISILKPCECKKCFGLAVLSLYFPEMFDKDAYVKHTSVVHLVESLLESCKVVNYKSRSLCITAETIRW